MPILTRRTLLLGTAGVAAAGYALQAEWSSGYAATPQPLRYPGLIDARAQGNAIALRAMTGRTAFFAGRDSATLGFNGPYLGPTLRLHRGDDVEIAVTNTMPDSTAVHWHGLLVPAIDDGGPHQPIRPGATWRPRFKIDQPAATLLYHAHPDVQTARQVYYGLAGLLIVTDAAEQAIGLPSEYGIDDLPLVLQDKVFDEAGFLVYPAGPMVAMAGVRGGTLMVNGIVNAFARVPGKLVRLRLANASNARTFDLTFSDDRAFHWIGTDAALLDRPVERRSLWLSPGQRAEILVDFSDGRPVALRTAPDPTLAAGMMGMMGGGDPLSRRTEILRFEPEGKGARPAIPRHLVAQERLDPASAVRRRRVLLTMGMGGMQGGMGRGMMGGGGMGRGMLGIDGRPFDMERTDQMVRLGDLEIWEVSGQMMSHPFHMHGVHFDVLSRGGSRPSLGDQGRRDTVLVKEPVEILVRFTQPAPQAPFMYHCHILEHEDGGMMAQYQTT